MNNSEALDLITKWQQHKCTSSRNKLILNCHKLLYKKAHKYANNNNLEDLVNEGVLALIKACDDHNSDKGTDMLPYLAARISYRMVYVVRNDKLVPDSTKGDGKYNLSLCAKPQSHREIAELAKERNIGYRTVMRFAQTGACSDAGLPEPIDNTQQSPELLVEQLERTEMLCSSVEMLNKEYKDIINMYYVEELDMTAIGKVLGYTKQGVWGRMQRSLAILRNNVRN